MKAFLREILFTLLLAAIIFFILQTTVQSFVVVGPSMEPNLQDGERLLVNKAVYFFHKPGRGDIVVFRPPSESRLVFIKRIIGLPGDTIEVKKGAVYVNSTQLEEPYINHEELPQYSVTLQKIPENQYFVLGDNRSNSNDSHYGWTVPRGNIVGKAWLSIWPPGAWGLVPNYQLATALKEVVGERG